MLAGFKSLCTYPYACKALRLFNMQMPRCRTNFSVQTELEILSFCKAFPMFSSMIQYISYSGPLQNTLGMYFELILLSKFASLYNAPDSSSFFESLIATVLPLSVSIPSNTALYYPFAKKPFIRNRPPMISCSTPIFLIYYTIIH